MCGVSLTHPVLPSFFPGSFSDTSRVGVVLFCFYLGSFSYASRAGLFFIGGVSLTHLMLGSFLSGEFLLHIPCWLHSCFVFVFIRGVCLTHPMLDLLFCGDFYEGSFSYTSHVGLKIFLSGDFHLHIPCWFLSFFIGGVSLTHPMLGSILSG